MNLFDPVVPCDRYHPNFKAALSPLSQGEREVIERWAHGFADRDHKFVPEFQVTFNACFWELYLHAIFREFGFQFDWSYEAPDFALSKGTLNFTVEATTANAAQGKPNEWDRELTEDPLEKYPIPVINREATIRLASAITAKARKFRSDYRKLNHVAGRPFVIAVAPFDQPFFNLQCDRPIRSVLYDDYVDEEEYKRDPSKYPKGPPSVQLGTITKENGAEIELGFFNSTAMEEVSAVIFSSVATWGKATALRSTIVKQSHFQALRLQAGVQPAHISGDHTTYRESLEDGLQIYHNPYAKVPLDRTIFSRPGVVQIDRDGDGKLRHEGAVGSLVWRWVWSAGSSDALGVGERSAG